MLALLTLIHEDYKQLPDKRAELYEHTVELLDRWNIPSPADRLHEKLANIDLDRMRAALKLIAFELHSEQQTYQRYPTIIQRARLLDKLIEQQSLGSGLGAGIEDVLEYLATRNGILVSDAPNLYRFPHLTIQEYLAAQRPDRILRRMPHASRSAVPKRRGLDLSRKHRRPAMP